MPEMDGGHLSTTPNGWNELCTEDEMGDQETLFVKQHGISRGCMMGMQELLHNFKVK